MGRKVGVAFEATVDDKATDPLNQIVQKLDDLKEAQEKATEAEKNDLTQKEVIGAIYNTLKDSITGAIGLVVEWTKGAMEAEKAERDLSVALRTHGANATEIVPKLQAFNAAIQAQTGISGDNIMAMQAQMTALGVLPSNLEAATTAAIGWSQATGKDMAEAGRDVVKVLNGKITVLEKAGIQTTSVTDAIHKMADGYALAAEQGQSLEGRIAVLNENVGDFEEVLGGAFSQSEALKGGVSAVSGTVVQLQEVFASPEGKDAVNSFFMIAIDGVAYLLDASVGLVKYWDEEVVGAWRRAKFNWNQWFGDGSGVFEPLNEGTDQTKANVLEKFTELADNLHAIAAGKPIELPPVVAPTVGPVTAQGSTADETAQEKELKRMNAAMEKEADRARLELEEIYRKEAEAEIKIGEEKLARQFDQYRAGLDRMNKDLEAQDKKEQADAKAREQMIIASGQAIVASLTSNLSKVGTIVNGMRFTVGDAIKGMLLDIFHQIVDFLINRTIITFFKFIAGGFTAKNPLTLLSFLGFADGGEVKGYADGGMVTGGEPGKDSVPAWLTPGEFVMPVSLVNAIKRGDSPSNGMFADGGMVTAPAAVGGPTIIVQPVYQGLAYPTEADNARFLLSSVVPAFQRLSQAGLLNLTGQRNRS